MVVPVFNFTDTCTLNGIAYAISLYCVFTDVAASGTPGLSIMASDIKEELIDEEDTAVPGLSMSLEIKEEEPSDTPGLTMTVDVKEEQLSAATSSSSDHGKHITAKR